VKKLVTKFSGSGTVGNVVGVGVVAVLWYCSNYHCFAAHQTVTRVFIPHANITDAELVDFERRQTWLTMMYTGGHAAGVWIVNQVVETMRTTKLAADVISALAPSVLAYIQDPRNADVVKPLLAWLKLNIPCKCPDNENKSKQDEQSRGILHYLWSLANKLYDVIMQWVWILYLIAVFALPFVGMFVQKVQLVIDALVWAVKKSPQFCLIVLFSHCVWCVILHLELVTFTLMTRLFCWVFLPLDVLANLCYRVETYRIQKKKAEEDVQVSSTQVAEDVQVSSTQVSNQQVSNQQQANAHQDWLNEMKDTEEVLRESQQSLESSKEFRQTTGASRENKRKGR